MRCNYRPSSARVSVDLQNLCYESKTAHVNVIDLLPTSMRNSISSSLTLITVVSFGYDTDGLPSTGYRPSSGYTAEFLPNSSSDMRKAPKALEMRFIFVLSLDERTAGAYLILRKVLTRARVHAKLRQTKASQLQKVREVRTSGDGGAFTPLPYRR